MGKIKWLKDAVHGYIKLDEYFFSFIIDTPHFQRLRRIEQTSMRMLYPSARHDRFVHSIGVFSLGEKAFDCFHKNVQDLGENVFIDRYEEFSKDDESTCLYKAELDSFKTAYSTFILRTDDYWSSRRLNFMLACLLHDVGHAPFSHSLEDFFMQEKGLRDSSEKGLLEKAGLPDDRPYIVYALWKSLRAHANIEIANQLLRDYILSGGSAPHEIVSAALLLNCFRDKIEGLFEALGQNKESISFDFMVRCITGVTYKTCSDSDSYKCEDIYRRMDNCLIKLLSGKSFDVDKLDYLLRDNATAGIESSKIDVDRLLSSLTIRIAKKSEVEKTEHEDIYYIIPAINKSAASIVENMRNASDELYLWTYSHHKVIYFSYLLKNSILQLNKLNNDEVGSDANKYIKTIFSVEQIEENLLCDDDIWMEIKKNKERIWEIGEWIEHGSGYVSLWKSYADLNGALLKADLLDNQDFLNRIRQKLKPENVEIFTEKLFKALFNQGFYADGDKSSGKPKIILVLASAKQLVWDLPVRMPNGCYLKFTEVMNQANMANSELSRVLFYIYVERNWYEDNESDIKPEKILNAMRHQSYK